MIYEEPHHLLSGDRYLLIEFGNEMNIDLNFKALGLTEEIRKNKVQGVIETVPSFASILVHYEPAVIDQRKLIAALDEFIAGLKSIENLELPSRLIELPVAYSDRWTRECVEWYCKNIKEIPPNPEFVAELNGLKSVKELVKHHSTPQYWVAAIGFWPGLPFLMSLDPRYFLTVPKYNPPRTWTPQGTVAVGGGCTGIYPVNTPGGYQLLGRTPVRIYDGPQKHPAFKESSVLLRTGDRVKFAPIPEEDFEEIEQSVNEGRYRHNIVTYELFSVGRYNEFLHEARKEMAAEEVKANA